MGSKIGTQKVAASRLGLPIEEYLGKIQSGFWHCTKCKQWKLLEYFYKDSTRANGHSAKCMECTNAKSSKERPNRRTYKQMAEKGFSYCRQCKEWLPKEEVKRGLCKHHWNEYYREKYQSNIAYRSERREHAHSRKRNIDPIPVCAKEMLLEDFGGRCAYCEKIATTWDHIIPISKGGKTTPGNIVPACASCNSSKNNKDIDTWIKEKGLETSTQLIEKIILAEAGLYG